MAFVQLLGSHIGFYVRQSGTSDVYKRLVCEENITFDIQNATSEMLTKCGYAVGVAVATFKANGTAAHNTTPGAAELSMNDVNGYQIGRTLLDYVVQNEAHDAVLEGAEVRLSGTGYFVGCQGTGNANEVVKFSWNFTGVGTPDNTAS